MEEVDKEHLLIWMDCVGVSSMHDDVSTNERQQLSASVDLPPQFGGVGLQFIVRVDDEKLLGSWASVTTDIIAFFRSKGLQVYDNLANALDTMADEETKPETTVIPAVASLQAVNMRAPGFLANISVT